MTNAVQSTYGDDAPAAPTSGHVFVVQRGDGFRASVRGHVLDLVDPSSYAQAPSTDDLLVVSVAAAVAWSARSFLRAHRLPDYVSVSAEWRTTEDPPSPAGIDLKVTVSRPAEAMSAALATALENSLAAPFLVKPVVHLSFEGS